MSVWYEIHCDKLLDGIDPNDILQAQCYSHRNQNPCGWSMKAAIYEAKQTGWFLARGKAVCPGCRNQPRKDHGP